MTVRLMKFFSAAPQKATSLVEGSGGDVILRCHCCRKQLSAPDRPSIEKRLHKFRHEPWCRGAVDEYIAIAGRPDPSLPHGPFMEFLADPAERGVRMHGQFDKKLAVLVAECPSCGATTEHPLDLSIFDEFNLVHKEFCTPALRLAVLETNYLSQ